MKCSNCDAGETVPAEVMLRAKVGVREFVMKVRGRKCPSCKQDVVRGPDFERFELEIARALSAAEPSGEALRRIRKTMGLRGVDLARLLDVTPETVSRWESEKHAVDRGAWVLLGLLVTERIAGSFAVENALRAAETPRELPLVVEIELQRPAA